MSAATIDLNADVGEGFGAWRAGDDAGLLRAVSSASVACGFHAGDPLIMRETCELAAAHGVRVGAHVGYRDLAGFGRRRMDVSAAVLREEVAYQVGGLAACAARAGAAVAYVKPHGALYHRCTADEEAAAAVVDAVAGFEGRLAVVGAPGAALLELARRAGLPAVAEGFADRRYAPDGGLVDRREPGAVLGAEDAVAQGLRLTTGDRGGERVRTLCVHGDTPGAAALAAAVRSGLEAAGVRVAAFA